jgi:lipid-binding SYLF domain-containing protein
MRYACLLCLVALAACKTAGGSTAAEKRASTRQMRDDALKMLYQRDGSVKAKLEKAAGYAAFSNFGAKILLAGTGNGYGMIVDNKTGKETFMRMAELNVGLGLGVKDFRAIFVFTDAAVMKKFAESGWDFGGDAGAGAKKEGEGGDAAAAASAQGMWIYVLTETGVELQATVGGTKYWKDEELN